MATDCWATQAAALELALVSEWVSGSALAQAVLGEQASALESAEQAVVEARPLPSPYTAAHRSTHDQLDPARCSSRP